MCLSFLLVEVVCVFRSFQDVKELGFNSQLCSPQMMAAYVEIRATSVVLYGLELATLPGDAHWYYHNHW